MTFFSATIRLTMSCLMDSWFVVGEGYFELYKYNSKTIHD